MPANGSMSVRGVIQCLSQDKVTVVCFAHMVMSHVRQFRKKKLAELPLQHSGIMWFRKKLKRGCGSLLV